ncbi:lamin tail domain-containing protein 2 [Talpa occidentalis]|uniref:lamin tail domain-containing protein 2 n=1 Tax=Talpa occidentalis TaxID=50954 RepID=UPI00188FAB5F|nr:lamin tail domain-containing protein 2 [Talpa occidentalis]
MAPESYQEAGAVKEEDFSSTVIEEPGGSHMEPAAGTPADLPSPTCPQDAKSSYINRLAPEGLDPSTLRLLWGQRDLEVQALRWAIWNRQEARHCHILQEVLGLPPERSGLGQEKLLQNQVQKLTVELKEEKERAEQVKAHLEQQLQHALSTLQQLEAQLHVFQKSCLLQLARASWLGCMLRSSTGSVEVVTAETLMDPTELSDNDQVPTAGEQHFRLEDVDWNSIAHRYPNLFSNIESNLEHKLPPPGELPPAAPEEDQSWTPHKHKERRLKSVEWCSLPFVGGSSSGSADSDSSSNQQDAHHPAQKGPRHWPGHEATEAKEAQAQPKGLSLGLQKTHSDLLGKTVSAPSLEPQDAEHQPSPSQAASCLRIMAVSRQERFVRILNQSLEETADLGGLVLQQRVGAAPVCSYRFPPRTQLAPRHIITVWGEGTASPKKQLLPSLGREPVHFHSGPGCVTLLLSPKGEVLSEHRAPHCVTAASRIFADNTDLSIDRFPVLEAPPGPLAGAQPRQPRQPGPPPKGRALRRTRGTRVLLPRLGACKPRRPREAARPKGAEARTPEQLPRVAEAGPGLEDGGAGKERRTRVGGSSAGLGGAGRSSVGGGARAPRSTAESRPGVLSRPPFATDMCGRVRGRCGPA